MNNNNLSPPSKISMLQMCGQNEGHLQWLNHSTAIHLEVVAHYQQMQQAALTDNLTLRIASGWRSFDRQLLIWNNKFSGKTKVKDLAGNTVDFSHLTDVDKVLAILLYSALPGTSRHHWGTDIDIYAKNLLPPEQKLHLEPWEYQVDGPFAQLSTWLNKYSSDFGFYFPYQTFNGGIAAEPWHLSFKALADQYQQALSVEQIKKLINSVDICGKQAIINNIEMIHHRFILTINR